MESGSFAFMGYSSFVYGRAVFSLFVSSIPCCCCCWFGSFICMVGFFFFIFVCLVFFEWGIMLCHFCYGKAFFHRGRFYSVYYSWPDSGVV